MPESSGTSASSFEDASGLSASELSASLCAAVLYSVSVAAAVVSSVLPEQPARSDTESTAAIANIITEFIFFFIKMLLLFK